jgi:glycerol-3-phosphate acyltransferase PlsY
MPLTPLCTAAGYLIGSIPFAYLVVKWLRGIDIRTVGSGNPGATNAGRLLGFRFFLLIFAFDMLKGFAPTWLIPGLVEGATKLPWPHLPVLVALATILGHNFPVWLGFKGGKGVATSLGAILALDPAAAAAAAGAFGAFLLVTRYVSLSSVGGGIVLVLVHLTHTPDPWGPDGRLLSAVLVGLLVMLVVRHRANFRRVLAGTEPKVPLTRAERAARREAKAGTPPAP